MGIWFEDDYDIPRYERPSRDDFDYPSAAELAADAAEDARAEREGHEFELPCGPEDFAPRPSWRSDAANQVPDDADLPF